MITIKLAPEYNEEHNHKAREIESLNEKNSAEMNKVLNELIKEKSSLFFRNAA